MSGYDTITRLRRLEAKVNQLGFKFALPKHHYENAADMVSLTPRDDESVPIYSRDAEVFSGTLEDLAVWVRGVEWARTYDRMLKVSDDEKRARKEQDVRNRHTVQRLKSETVDQLK